MRYRQRHCSPAEAFLVPPQRPRQCCLPEEMQAGMRAVLDAARILDYAAWYFRTSPIGLQSKADTLVLTIHTPARKETPDAVRVT
jgi:hypothetical protein